MELYEYKVIPAPVRGEKARGVKTTAERFALTLTGLMNQMGADGWVYVRADALPCEERSGLTGTKTTYQNMLVFRRPLAALATTIAPAVAVAPAPPVLPAPVPAPKVIEAEAPAAVVAAPSVTVSEPASAPSLGGANRRDLAAE